MKPFAALILCIAISIAAQAQCDTALHRNLPPIVAGGALVGTGAVLAFQPQAHSLAEALRNEVVRSDMPKMHFDNYLQYTPPIAPIALNLCGLKSRHSIGRIAVLEGTSYLIGAGWLNAGKYRFGVLRPDNSTYNSFPSGHTFMAFTGAELLRREYGEEYPWVGIAGYAVATIVGIMRIYNNRHWAGDVLAGAGIGIMSVGITYWLLD